MLRVASDRNQWPKPTNLRPGVAGGQDKVELTSWSQVSASIDNRYKPTITLARFRRLSATRLSKITLEMAREAGP